MSLQEIDYSDIEQARAIMKIIHSRIKALECIDNENKESIAYRIAEIMAASKNLYTKILPRLIDENSTEDLWELLVEMRMHYLHQIDLLTEFDEFFIESIIAEEEENEES